MAGCHVTLAIFLSSLTSASAKTYFSETFGDGWESRWTLSTWKDSDKEKMGKWVAASGRWFLNEAEDRGLQTAQIMKFYGISAPFESFSNAGKDLVIQYQAKYEKDLGCGGGYLKIGPKQDDLTKFGDPTPYNIMFGPDQCNADKRTHLIFSHKGKNYLKKSELPYKQEGEGISHLYRLVLKPDDTVRVEVDQEKIYEGSLSDDWDMVPAKEIVDPNDKKPDDWVDLEKMADPDDKKPDDWNEAKRVPDPTATKPEEWDDDEDGEWEPPKVDNPEYKGEWKAKQIPNPAYKGAWNAKKIPNPDYSDSPEPLHKYSDFGYVGIDVWQVKGGTIFDNIIITDNVEEAESFAKRWKALNEHENAEKKKSEEDQSAAFAKARAARAARDAIKNPPKAENDDDSDDTGAAKDKTADAKEGKGKTKKKSAEEL